MKNNSVIPFLQSTIEKTTLITNTLPWKIIIVLPIIFTIIMVAIISILYSTLPPQIPLYYSRPWGEDQLTEPKFLFILPIGSFIGYIVTVIMIASKTNEYRVFSQILLLFQAGLSGVALLVIINIIRLVT